MKTKMSFDFCVGYHLNRAMNMAISVNTKIIEKFENLSMETLQVCFEVDLPGVIVFEVSGRHPTDTLIDKHGNIVKDVYIQLRQIILHEIDDLSIPAWSLPQSHAYFLTDDQTRMSDITFWSRNGKFTINIDRTDILIWLLDHKSLIFELPTGSQ